MTRANTYNRETAIDAAVMLFWQKGYHATSLKDLEAALSMKPGSIYAAFSNKETLFGLALERYFETNRADFLNALQSAPSPLGALTDYIRSVSRAAGRDANCQACMLVKTVLNATAADIAASTRAERYLTLMEDEMAAAFDKAKELGELPQDIDTRWLARRYQSGITALRIEAHRHADQNQLSRSADDLAQIFEAMRIPSD